MRDPEKAKARKRRYLARLHAEKYGPNAGDMRGKQKNRARGARHPRWNARGIISTEGYVKVRVGTDHPLADPHGYAYEHLLVWAAAGKRLPRADELLHHIDEDKTNNRLDNLELMTRAEHSRLHVANRSRDSHGRFAEEKEAA